MVFGASDFPDESSFSVNGGTNSGTMVAGNNDCPIVIATGAHTF